VLTEIAVTTARRVACETVRGQQSQADRIVLSVSSVAGSCTSARSSERKGEARGRGLRGYLCGEDEAAKCGR
jgi:hypothetical protein